MSEEQAELTESKPVPVEQYANELVTWLNERGLVIVPVAQGRKTGRVYPFDDFLDDGLVATYTLQKVQP